MKLRLGIFMLVLLFLGGCTHTPEKPDHLIPEKKYINLLVELQLARTYGENVPTDSATVDSLSQVIYNKYGVTAQQFKASHSYYQQFPNEQKKRTEEAIEKLKMDYAGVRDSTNSDREIPKHH